MSEDGAFDDLVAMLDEAPAAGGEDEDIDALLGLPPSAESQRLGSSSSAARGKQRGASDRERGLVQDHGATGKELSQTPTDVEVRPDDLPLDTILPVPPEVVLTPFVLTAQFKLRCELDLKKIAFGVRNAEYNPRKHGSITLRLVEPRATALVRASGVCSITGSKISEEDLKASAKKVARLVQRCGHDDAKFVGYSVISVLCKANMHFPIRLDVLAMRWRRHAVYEPEMYCGCVFRTRQPKRTYLITAGGHVMISGCRNVDEAVDALRRIYPILVDLPQDGVGGAAAGI
mmetsp:Transcript_88306/g.248679  ORF Transcript_88306/g.248679 Transcript_88306/m.248679 type:complete len:289 (+) Transcript_88306:80-946(+)